LLRNFERTLPSVFYYAGNFYRYFREFPRVVSDHTSGNPTGTNGAEPTKETPRRETQKPKRAFFVSLGIENDFRAPNRRGVRQRCVGVIPLHVPAAVVLRNF